MMKRPGVVLVAFAMALSASRAEALTIEMVYDEEATPAYDPDGSQLMMMANAAAALWQDYFVGEGSMTIDVSWSDLDADTLGLAAPQSNSIWLQANPSSPWYIDATPSTACSWTRAVD